MAGRGNCIDIHQEYGRYYYATPRTPSLSFTCLLWKPSALTLAVRRKRKLLIQENILWVTAACRSFRWSPSFQTVSKAQRDKRK
jgi:hypothetical protein